MEFCAAQDGFQCDLNDHLTGQIGVVKRVGLLDEFAGDQLLIGPAK